MGSRYSLSSCWREDGDVCPGCTVRNLVRNEIPWLLTLLLVRWRSGRAGLDGGPNRVSSWSFKSVGSATLEESMEGKRGP